MHRIARTEAKPLKLQSPGRPGVKGAAGVAAWLIESWVRFGGRCLAAEATPWLERSIGQHSVEGRELPGTRGLLGDFSQLDGPMCSSHNVDPRVVDFFERTSLYRLDRCAEWCGVLRPMGPLLGTSMEGWLERIDYSLCAPPNYPGACLRRIHPLLHGFANVILRPESQLDGSFALTSCGKTFGGPGIYGVVQSTKGRQWVRRIGSLGENMHVYVDSTGTLRADHESRLWGRACLKLHYRMELEPEAA